MDLKPQIVSYNIEGDNDYFPVSYYGHQNAWLAQTAEFHQQMAMSMDMPRVFEVRSMFRAENDQNSKRRLAEVCKRQSFGQHVYLRLISLSIP